MTVAEMIEYLSKMPPNAKLLVYDGSDNSLVGATAPTLDIVTKWDFLKERHLYNDGEQIVVI